MLPYDNYFHNTTQVLSGEMGEKAAMNILDRFGIDFHDWTKIREEKDIDIFHDNKVFRTQIKNTLTGSWVVEGGRAGDYYSYTKKMIDVMFLVYYQKCWVIPAEVWEQKAKGFHNMKVADCDRLFSEYQNNLSFNGCTEQLPADDNLIHLLGED